MTRAPLLPILLMPLALAACASKPAPVIGPPLTSYADMSFGVVPAQGKQPVEIAEGDRAFAFPEGPAGFNAFALPASAQPRFLRFRSDTSSGAFASMKVLIPRFVFLDQDKNPAGAVAPHPVFRASAYMRGIYFTGQVRVPEQARFVVVTAAASTREPLVVSTPNGAQYTLPLLAAGESELELASTPMAAVKDSVVTETAAKAQMFLLEEIDGKPVANSAGESATLSRGRAGGLTTTVTNREVPARKLKARLLGTHQTGAPIHAIFSSIAGTFLKVEGVVDFEPLEGRQYVVKGHLREGGSSVWIEDAETGQLATERVVAP